MVDQMKPWSCPYKENQSIEIERQTMEDEPPEKGWTKNKKYCKNWCWGEFNLDCQNCTLLQHLLTGNHRKTYANSTIHPFQGHLVRHHFHSYSAEAVKEKLFNSLKKILKFHDFSHFSCFCEGFFANKFMETETNNENHNLITCIFWNTYRN